MLFGKVGKSNTRKIESGNSPDGMLLEQIILQKSLNLWIRHVMALKM